MPLGITSKAYVNLGTYNAPLWEEMNLIGDLNVPMQWNLADGSTRAMRVQQQEPTNLTMDITGKMRKSMNNTAFLAVRAAFLTCVMIDVMILDGALDVNGSEGIRCDFKVSQFGEDQALQNVTFKDFTLTPCITDNYPQSVIVNGGAPDFTPIAPAPLV